MQIRVKYLGYVEVVTPFEVKQPSEFVVERV